MPVDPTSQPQAQSLGSANTHSFSSLGDRRPSLEDLENGPIGASRQGKTGLEHSFLHPGRLPTPSSLSAFLEGDMSQSVTAGQPLRDLIPSRRMYRWGRWGPDRGRDVPVVPQSFRCPAKPGTSQA